MGIGDVLMTMTKTAQVVEQVAPSKSPLSILEEIPIFRLMEELEALMEEVVVPEEDLS